MIRFECPTCGKTMKCAEKGAGRKITCPKCFQRVRIPTPPKEEPKRTVLGKLLPENTPSKQEIPSENQGQRASQSSNQSITVMVKCPGCSRSIQYLASELAGICECAKCGARFTAKNTPDTPSFPKQAKLPQPPTAVRPPVPPQQTSAVRSHVPPSPAKVPTAQLFVPCPGCSRMVGLASADELRIEIECAQCGTVFVPVDGTDDSEMISDDQFGHAGNPFSNFDTKLAVRFGVFGCLAMIVVVVVFLLIYEAMTIKDPPEISRFLLGGIVFSALLIVYFLPTLVAYTRKHTNAVAILILNIFTGWTFVGYIVALVWAFTTQREQQQVIHHYHYKEDSK